jgi:N-acetylglutamate synthase-like GNAT family acetyltransferase
MTAAAFTIEPFSSAHHEAVAALVLKIQREEFAIPVTYEAQPDLQDIPGFFRKGAGEFWLAIAGGTPIGTIGLLDIGERRGVLRKMFVEAGWRGPGKGVAQGLLDVLLAHAGRQGLSEILLGTIDRFKAAQRFYRRNGFEEIPETALPAAFPRMHVDTQFFRRRI